MDATRKNYKKQREIIPKQYIVFFEKEPGVYKTFNEDALYLAPLIDSKNAHNYSGKKGPGLDFYWSDLTDKITFYYFTDKDESCYGILETDLWDYLESDYPDEENITEGPSISESTIKTVDNSVTKHESISNPQLSSKRLSSSIFVSKPEEVKRECKTCIYYNEDDYGTHCPSRVKHIFSIECYKPKIEISKIPYDERNKRNDQTNPDVFSGSSFYRPE